MADFLSLVELVRPWPQLAVAAGQPHPVWGISNATNADRIQLLRLLLKVLAQQPRTKETPELGGSAGGELLLSQPSCFFILGHSLPLGMSGEG